MKLAPLILLLLFASCVEPKQPAPKFEQIRIPDPEVDALIGVGYSSLITIDEKNWDKDLVVFFEDGKGYDSLGRLIVENSGIQHWGESNVYFYSEGYLPDSMIVHSCFFHEASIGYEFLSGGDTLKQCYTGDYTHCNLITFDASGKVLKVISMWDEISFEYDSLGRLTMEIDTFYGGRPPRGHDKKYIEYLYQGQSGKLRLVTEKLLRNGDILSEESSIKYFGNNGLPIIKVFDDSVRWCYVLF